jgi:two-component system, NtrC family, sensor histidine kinase HydH
VTRSTVLALVLVCALLACVLAGTVHLIRENRADLVDQFAARRLTQVTEAARLIDEDLDDIGDDLVVAGKLVRTAESPRDQQHQLGALLAVVEQYKLVRVYDVDGKRIAEVVDPLGPLQTSSTTPPAISRPPRRSSPRAAGSACSRPRCRRTARARR